MKHKKAVIPYEILSETIICNIIVKIYSNTFYLKNILSEMDLSKSLDKS